MKAFLVLSVLAATTTGVLAQSVPAGAGKVLVDPDFGMAFETPDALIAEMVGQTPEGLVLLTVAMADPDIPALDASGNLCDITFQYDPTYGQGDQQWVNSLVDGTGFYESMAREVIVPGNVERGENFTHRGSSSHWFYGQHELGGGFAVAAIPSPEGFVIVSCVTAAPAIDQKILTAIVDALTIPGQPRDHLVPGGSCKADPTEISRRLEQAGSGPFDAETILALGVEREKIARTCDGLHADVLMDEAVADAGHQGDYRDLRYDALARIGSDLLTPEQHAALDGGRAEVVASSDAATGERYLRYMHFIVGLRSLEQ